MERSQFAPSIPEAIRLTDDDYRVPCHGLGLTGHERKIELGTFSRDKGEHSSRLARIIKQAGKTPGPGKYIGHTTWAEPSKVAGTRNIYDTVTRFGAKFESSSREFKPLNKVPAPNHYERKDVATERPLESRGDLLSTRRRLQFGRCSKGPKRSFLDSVMEQAKTTPSAGTYWPKELGGQILANKLEVHKGGPTLNIKVTLSKKPPAKAEIAPNHYNPQYIHAEERLPNWTVPKAKGNNFVDKAVRSKMLDKKTPFPGPGQNDVIEMSLVTRGTKKLTLSGLSRGACSGYF